MKNFKNINISANGANGNCLSNNRKTKLTGLAKILVANLDKKNNWPGLVFLQKRGSSHANPNPNIISYKFPGAKTTPAVANGATSVSVATKLNLNRFFVENVYKLLFSFFKSMHCLISKPVIIFNQDNIKIQLFYFVAAHPALAANGATAQLSRGGAAAPLASANGGPNTLITKVYPDKFKLICSILSKFFNKTVELELIRLHKPYYDSTILVNFLALIINKKNIANCIKKLYDSTIIQAPPVAEFEYATGIFNKLDVAPANGGCNENKKAIDLINNWLGLSSSHQPPCDSWAAANGNQRPTLKLAGLAPAGSSVVSAAYLAGLNIKISGRLMREAIVPRITTKKFEKGFTANGKINYSDVARFTHKNRRGAFTITIKSGQKF